jgi:hypothetical protein
LPRQGALEHDESGNWALGVSEAASGLATGRQNYRLHLRKGLRSPPQAANIHDPSIARAKRDFVPIAVTPAVVNKVPTTAIDSSYVAKSAISENSFTVPAAHLPAAIEIASDAKSEIEIDRHGIRRGRTNHRSDKQQSANTKQCSSRANHILLP